MHILNGPVAQICVTIIHVIFFFFWPTDMFVLFVFYLFLGLETENTIIKQKNKEAYGTA